MEKYLSGSFVSEALNPNRWYAKVIRIVHKKNVYVYGFMKTNLQFSKTRNTINNINIAVISIAAPI